jgi:hypothetical protein
MFVVAVCSDAGDEGLALGPGYTNTKGEVHDRPDVSGLAPGANDIVIQQSNQ